MKPRYFLEIEIAPMPHIFLKKLNFLIVKIQIPLPFQVISFVMIMTLILHIIKVENFIYSTDIKSNISNALVVNRFMHLPKQSQETTLRILCYIKRTLGKGLLY